MQLQMILREPTRFAQPGDAPRMPDDYRLRTYRAGDGPAYVSLMRTAFDEWSGELFERTLAHMLPGGLFFVEHLPTASLVATAVAGHEHSALHGSAAELGWVVVDPVFRGNGFGDIVCDAVLRRFVAAGFDDIYLKTDDWRLPAIRIYLRLGFVPLIHAADMPERWALVYEKLGLKRSALEDDAVRTVRDNSAAAGYRPWKSATETEARQTPPSLRVGLLPLYLDLYDRRRPELRDSVDSFLDDVGKLIERAGVEVVRAPIATLRRHVDAAEELFGGGRVDLVVTLHLAYSPSLLVVEFLSQLDTPILVLDSTPARSFELDDDRYLLENHAVHGVMDLTSVLVSKGVEFRVVAGHIDLPEFQRRLSTELDGALMAKRFRNQRIGLTGSAFVGMGDFSIDAEAVAKRFGIEAVALAPETIVAAAARIADAEVDRRIEADRDAFDLSEVDTFVHRRSARCYLALRRLCAEHGLSAYTMNFEQTGPSLPPPFYAASRLMADGYGYAGEGDVVTAGLGRALNVIDGRSMFSEVFCVDWETDEVLFSHMGEINPLFAAGARSILMKRALGHEEPSLYFRFSVDSMKITMVNIGVSNGVPSRLVVATLDIVERDPSPGITAPHFFASPETPVAEFLEEYARLGGGHHVYLCEGDIRRRLRVMCSHLGLAFHEVR